MVRKKKIVAEQRTFVEAVAIKERIDNLNKKLGKRERATIKRKGTTFQVWN